MAGNPSQQDKMAVYNAAESKHDASTRNDIGRDELSQGISKTMPKTKSIDGHSKKKSSFQITSVIDRGSSGMYHTNEDLDSIDDLDDTCETHTEDVSSDILDLSKNTDIEPEPSSEETTPSFTTEEPPRDFSKVSVPTHPQQPPPVAQPPPQEPQTKTNNDMQSRFKVVKIESKEPFKRGRWMCQDFLDPLNEKGSERTDKADNKEDVGSGNSSASSSIHYVHGVDDPSKNPLAGVVMSDVHSIVEPQPIYPAASQGQKLQNGEYAPSYHNQPSSQVSASGTQPPEQPPPSQNTSYDLGQGYDAIPGLIPGQSIQQKGHAQVVLGNGKGAVVHPKGVPVGTMPGQPPSDTNLEYVAQSLPATDVGQTSQAAASVGHTMQQPDYTMTSATPNIPVQNPVVVVAAKGSSKTSPNTETIQGSEVLGQDMAYASSVDDNPQTRMDTINIVTAESDSDSDEGAAGGAGASSTARQAAAAQSFLSPPLLEMVSAAMQQPTSMKDEGEDR